MSRMFFCGDEAERLEEQGRFDEAIVLLQEQERLARDLRDYDQLACALFNQASLLSDRFARPAEARACADEALAFFHVLGLPAKVTATIALLESL